MECTCVHLTLVELFIEPLCGVLRVDEDEAPLFVLPVDEELVQDFEQFVVLALWRYLLQSLLNSVYGAAHDAHTNPNVVVEEVLCHPLAWLWEGSREHHRL